MLRVTLEDGRVVGGYFGEKSLAGYTARTRDLIIEQRWIFNDDDWFERPAEGSLGLWTLWRLRVQFISMASDKRINEVILKRGGMSIRTNGFRPTQPPPKPADAAYSARPKK